MASQGAASEPPGFPGGWPTAASPVFPVVSGPITVVLSPLSPSAPAGTSPVAPAALPQITCDVYLGQYVHYSTTGKDISWHWTWSCDGYVFLYGGHALYFDTSPWVTGAVANTGYSGNENLRYNGCLSGLWYGQAYGTFSAVGYSPASFEGSSPENVISCP